ncbi:phosphoribosylformylglycinamidine synthase [Bengtsoniella intestinalis]|uniref:phosphoribosylformylglycinamidine synthase n=1 Tax=Bengtsoniella intestinalis TaxID=3073143 RepID=UPI00391F7FF0
MVERIYVEKKSALRHQAESLLQELQTILGVTALSDLRLINRYDVEGLADSAFSRAVTTVLSEPQLDDVYTLLPDAGDAVFAVEYLPGQFDQRADSAAQCIQLMTQGERPLVRSAVVYLLFGDLTVAELNAIRDYVINPVEAREASLDTVTTLVMETEAPQPPMVLTGFTDLDEAGLTGLISEFGLAMDSADLLCCRDYFRTEHRNPTITELRLLDTYWSDHCRHTTFGTHLNTITIEDARVQKAYDRYLAIRKETGRDARPVTLMDMGTVGAKYLKQTGNLPAIDESEEINACTVKIDVDQDGEMKPWLLLFKNETHNHPTEIEPFGGAATCIGGAIRDPLAGRGYVYQAMRVTGAADPRTSLEDTIAGKLPQRKIVQSAAQGYSSYGNQIGLATGLVDEIYHAGYAAKRMEIGAVVGAVPADYVRREIPEAGDVVILVGGRTGRDGCGGATGSSKSHDAQSVATCSAEVQKGNAPEERKLQRLFRNGEAMSLIKRCNDFGAGGVSVAVGELSESLAINLNAVPKKYDGLDATELAISESQERMAVVVEAKDAARFIALSNAENLEATLVAEVTDTGRMTMDWNGQRVADLSRAFLDTNGAFKEATVSIPVATAEKTIHMGGFVETLTQQAGDLRHCSRFGLAQRFDATIGAGSVVMPFGGKHQKTPTQSMVAKLPVLGCETTTCSIMAWGGDPHMAVSDPYGAAYLAVVDSVAKVIAAGGHREKCWLSFQEYFPRLGNDASRWGLPVAAVLGALDAQLDLKVAAIGGKDSMSGSFNDLDVPPTLVSFAVSVGNTNAILSNEFKTVGNNVILVQPKSQNPTDICDTLNAMETALATGKVVSSTVVDAGGIAISVLKSAMGNGYGFSYSVDTQAGDLFEAMPCSFLLEVTGDIGMGTVLGTITAGGFLSCGCETVAVSDLTAIYDGVLESVYPTQTPCAKIEVPSPSFVASSYPAPKIGIAKPKVLIPVFPGTNCEFDSARAVERAGLTPEIMVIGNRTSSDIVASAERFVKLAQDSQIIFLPGGFSGGDEPDGSAKFITAFFRNQAVTDVTMDLLKNRDGLMLGICNGFQALVKLGLVPYGEIMDTDDTCPTLSHNIIGRHQSGIVSTRIASNKSPWLSMTQTGDVYTVPISHGEGRFLCDEALCAKLAENGQIATQYVDFAGNPTLDIAHNPNGSIWAIEGITSPDGRVLGKMGHSERIGPNLYQNVMGDYDMKLFQSAKKYFAI